MFVVEFVGCPGAGKSALCKSVMNEFSKRGYAVSNIHRSECRDGRLTRLAIRAGSFFSGNIRGLRRVLSKKEAFFQDPMARVWANDILKAAYKLESRSVENLDFAFFEEGPAQYVTSIAHDILLTESAEPLMKEMNEVIYSHETLMIHVTAEMDELIRRIRHRERKTDRFLLENDSKIQKLLEIKEQNIEFVLERLHFRKLWHIENNDFEKAVAQTMSFLLEAI